MYQYAVILLIISLAFFSIGYKTRFRDENAIKIVKLDKVKKEDQLIYLRRFSHTMNAIGLSLSVSVIITLLSERISAISIVIAVIGIALSIFNIIKINKLYKQR